MKNNNFNLTLSMLAKMCNVSEGTVDRALHNRSGIKKETKEKILNVARKHGYIETADGGERLIGVVVFDLYNSYFSEFLMAFENECKENGFSMVVMFTNKDDEAEYKCIKQLYYMGVKGIVLCPINKGDAYENFLKSVNIPIITIGNRLTSFPYVGIDNFKATYDAAKSLSVKCGRIIYYSPALRQTDNITAQEDRYNGFIHYTKESGITYQVAKSLDELNDMLDRDGECAVLCSTDTYMFQVALRYPKLTVMGIDGVKFFKEANPMLMSVDTNIKQVASATLEAFISNRDTDKIVPHFIDISG